MTDVLLSGAFDLSNTMVRVSSTLSIVPRGMAAGEDADSTSSAPGDAPVPRGAGRYRDAQYRSAPPVGRRLVWAQAADAATVVATLDHSRRDDLAYAVESLRLVGANVAGTVLADRRRGFGRARAAAAAPPDPPPRRRCRIRAEGPDRDSDAGDLPIVDELPGALVSPAGPDATAGLHTAATRARPPPMAPSRRSTTDPGTSPDADRRRRGHR